MADTVDQIAQSPAADQRDGEDAEPLAGARSDVQAAKHVQRDHGKDEENPP